MHYTVVQQCIIQLCSNALYSCAAMRYTLVQQCISAAMNSALVQQCIIQLCSNALYSCAAMRYTLVQQCISAAMNSALVQQCIIQVCSNGLYGWTAMGCKVRQQLKMHLCNRYLGEIGCAGVVVSHCDGEIQIQHSVPPATRNINSFTGTLRQSQQSCFAA